MSELTWTEEEYRARRIHTPAQPGWTVLLRKPKEYADEDRKAKIDSINQRERSVLRSRNPEAAWKNPDAGGDYADGATYVPQGNEIKRAYTP